MNGDGKLSQSYFLLAFMCSLLIQNYLFFTYHKYLQKSEEFKVKVKFRLSLISRTIVLIWKMVRENQWLYIFCGGGWEGNSCWYYTSLFFSLYITLYLGNLVFHNSKNHSLSEFNWNKLYEVILVSWRSSFKPFLSFPEEPFCLIFV